MTADHTGAFRVFPSRGRSVGTGLAYRFVQGSGLLLESGGFSATTNQYGIAELCAIAPDQPGLNKIVVSAPEFPQASPVEFYIESVLPSVLVIKGYSETTQPGIPLESSVQIALSGPNFYGDKVDAKFTATGGVVIGPAATIEKENWPAIALVAMPGSLGGSVQVSFPEFPTLVVEPIAVPGVESAERGQISGPYGAAETFEGAQLLSSGAGQVAVAGAVFPTAFAADGAPILDRATSRLIASGFSVMQTSHETKISGLDFSKSKEPWQSVYSLSSASPEGTAVSGYGKAAVHAAGPFVISVEASAGVLGYKWDGQQWVYGSVSATWREYHVVYVKEAGVRIVRKDSSGNFVQTRAVAPARLADATEDNYFYVEKITASQENPCTVNISVQDPFGAPGPGVQGGAPRTVEQLALSFVGGHDGGFLYRSLPILPASETTQQQLVGDSAGRVKISGDFFGEIRVQGSNEDKIKMAGIVNLNVPPNGVCLQIWDEDLKDWTVPAEMPQNLDMPARFLQEQIMAPVEVPAAEKADGWSLLFARPEQEYGCPEPPPSVGTHDGIDIGSWLTKGETVVINNIQRNVGMVFFDGMYHRPPIGNIQYVRPLPQASPVYSLVVGEQRGYVGVHEEQWERGVQKIGLEFSTGGTRYRAVLEIWYEHVIMDYEFIGTEAECALYCANIVNDIENPVRRLRFPSLAGGPYVDKVRIYRWKATPEDDTIGRMAMERFQLRQPANSPVDANNEPLPHQGGHVHIRIQGLGLPPGSAALTNFYNQQLVGRILAHPR